MTRETALLLREMNRTAAALSRAPVVVTWDLIPEERRKDCTGYCTEQPYQGEYRIGIDPRQELGKLYRVYLHEVGHARLNALGMRLPDQEAAAWQIANTWAHWIARRAPANILECIGWVRRLAGYHEANPEACRFTHGANRGWILPGVKIK